METFRPKLILAPTDFSETAAHALRYASALAERFDAHLLVMYADPFMPAVDLAAIPAASFDLAQQNMIEEAREKLEVHAEENVRQSVPYDVRVIVGVPEKAIIEQAREAGADLIVMGTHGRSGVRRIVFGSVTAGVMRAAPVPVIAVNSVTAEDADVRKILCPVTFDPVCSAALRCAAAISSVPRAPIVLLQLLEEHELPGMADHLLRLREWPPSDLAGRCDFKILPAHSPDRTIPEIAEMTNSDLIALGIPESRSVSDILRGTLAEHVIRRSDCAVLTVNAVASRRVRDNAVERVGAAVL